MDNKDFWRSQAVIVTGGAGFFGRVVVQKLRDAGCRNLVVPRQAEFDLTNIAHINRLLDLSRPDMIIHMAAVCGGIGANMAAPADFFYKNLIMGVQLMESARLRKIPKFVSLGTICAYPKKTPVPFKEENLWDGYPEETNAPYGLAKKMLLVQGQAYRQQYGYNAIYLLPVNLYGPGDNFDLKTSHVIPALIRKFVEARDSNAPSVSCWGTGRVTREFLYVHDAADAVILAAERYNGAEPVNLGNGFEIQVSDLAEKIKSLTGFKGDIVWDASKPDGQPRRCLDTTKAKSLFGFVARVNLEEGLKRTIEWYETTRATMPTPIS